jgi:16S rRNA (cytidine1402-2'-O)-methyltransferase
VTDARTAAAGRLILLPVTLGESKLDAVIPQEVQQCVRTLDYFIAENPKSARAYLKQVGMAKPLQDLHIATLNEHTPDAAIAELAAPLLAGHDLGVMSEAGCPGIADPGAKLVRYAHQRGIRVLPLVGPSSILLALMASGLNGQSFAFHGYLPVADAEREKALRDLEQSSRRLNQTQIFIETPYRNQKLLLSILGTCAGTTLLCIAAEITLAGEDIRTKTVAAWKKSPPQLDRRPALFLLLAA